MQFVMDLYWTFCLEITTILLFVYAEVRHQRCHCSIFKRLALDLKYDIFRVIYVSSDYVLNVGIVLNPLIGCCSLVKARTVEVMKWFVGLQSYFCIKIHQSCDEQMINVMYIIVKIYINGSSFCVGLLLLYCCTSKCTFDITIRNFD